VYKVDLWLLVQYRRLCFRNEALLSVVITLSVRCDRKLVKWLATCWTTIVWFLGQGFLSLLTYRDPICHFDVRALSLNLQYFCNAVTNFLLQRFCVTANHWSHVCPTHFCVTVRRSQRCYKVWNSWSFASVSYIKPSCQCAWPPPPPPPWRFDTIPGHGISLRSLVIRLTGHTTLGRTPLDEWWARRRDLFVTTHDIHKRRTFLPHGGIRTKNPSKRAAADPRLRPRGRWDRHCVWLWGQIYLLFSPM
jgi:hypothetical protein